MGNEKEIAFSRRYMAYSWTCFLYGSGTPPPSFDYKLGDIQPYELDDKVLFGYTGLKDDVESMKSGFRRSGYNRLSRGYERRHT